MSSSISELVLGLRVTLLDMSDYVCYLRGMESQKAFEALSSSDYLTTC